MSLSKMTGVAATLSLARIHRCAYCIYKQASHLGRMMSRPTLILAHENPSQTPLPHPLALVRAGISGFPSPAQDYEGRRLDLNAHFIKRPAAAFFMTVHGDSMMEFGISDGSIICVDRSIQAKPGMVVVLMLDGEVTVKSLECRNGALFLCSGGDRYAPIPVAGHDHDFWGVVTSVHTAMLARAK